LHKLKRSLTYSVAAASYPGNSDNPMAQPPLSETMPDERVRAKPAERTIAASATLLPLLRQWWPVALLSLLYVISLTDRLILAILIQPLKLDLHLSDTQVALLIGSSFGFFYAVIGVPVAWAIDRGNRLVIGVAGIAIWSLSTIASGLVSHFSTLVTLRIGVAIGESVLSPLGVSLIADLFPRERRSVPMSVFIASGLIGIFAAYSMGGSVVALLEHGRLSHTPFVGALPTWRATLLLIGLPGLILALLMACTVRDPKRRIEMAPQSAAPDNRFGAFASKADLLRFYLCFCAGAGIIGMPTCAALAWYPSLLVRVFNVSLPQSGWFFSIALIAAAMTLIAVPHVMRYCERRGKAGSLVPITLVIAPLGSLLFGLSLAQGSLAATLPLLIIGYGLLAGGVNALPSIAIGLTAPTAYRGRIVALGLSSISLIGMGLGPYLTAVLADHLYAGPRALARAMLTLTVLAAPLACIFIFLSWSPLRRALQQRTVQAQSAPH
jgi:MFS family permease